MRKDDELYDLCLDQDLNVSISWQKMTSWSIEIYKGYKTNYINIFYTDGHTDKKAALKEAIEFMKEFNVLEWDKKNASSIDPTSPTLFESAEFITNYIEKHHLNDDKDDVYNILGVCAANYGWHIKSS